jgi:adenylate cyclase
MRLQSGDQIRIGQTILVFNTEVAPSYKRTITETQPIRLDTEEEPVEKGILTNTVNASELPTQLLLLEKQGQAPLDVVQRRLEVFYKLGTTLSNTTSVEGLLQTVVEHLCRAIPGAQRGALLLLEDNKLYLKAYLPLGIRPSISLYLARLTVKRKQAVTWRRDAPGELGKLTNSIVSHGTMCAMYAPLIWQEKILGIVYVDNFISEGAFADDDLNLLMAMASQAAMFVQNHILQEDLRHQQVVRSNLLRQFSPKVAEHIENILKEQGQLGLGGERVEPVTILNSDIRGFTVLSAQLEPNQVMEMLNELFGLCGPIIFKYHGTIDKYIGDAILAVFGGPDPDLEGNQWENAVRAALEMQYAIYKLGQRWEALQRPIFQVGIGIHTGPVLQGFLGSEERMEYTVIGDTVNRASRYCDGADRGEVVISPAVFERLPRGLIEVTPKLIQTKHPDTELDLQAFVVKGFSTQSLNIVL